MQDTDEVVVMCNVFGLCPYGKKGQLQRGECLGQFIDKLSNITRIRSWYEAAHDCKRLNRTFKVDFFKPKSYYHFYCEDMNGRYLFYQYVATK